MMKANTGANSNASANTLSNRKLSNETDLDDKYGGFAQVTENDATIRLDINEYCVNKDTEFTMVPLAASLTQSLCG